MGCSESMMSISTHPENASQVDKCHFISTGVLGEGGFGRVVAAMCIRNGNWYAVKEINKFELVKHKCGVSMIFGELAAMKKVDHPFVINLQLAFQDRYN
jgi:serine/threonine protein kinase